MYVSFVKEVSKVYYRLHNTDFKDNIYLTSSEEVDNIIEFIGKYGINEYKHILDTIGVKYDLIADNGLTYTINETILPISKLSSGERMLLYSNLLGQLNKPLLLIGLIDRMDSNHREVLKKYYSNLNRLVLLTFDVTEENKEIVNKFYRPFSKILEEGILE